MSPFTHVARLGRILVLVGLLGSACAPAAPPAATSASAKPTEAPKPAAPASPAANPAAASPAAPIAGPAAAKPAAGLARDQTIRIPLAEPPQLGVEAKDDRTLVVTLEKPAAYFLRLASTWALMPLRQDAIEKFGDKWTEPQNIVTNGLFRLKEWQHDTQIVLERNEDYWG